MKHPASRRRRRLAAAALAATGATLASLSLVPTAATALAGTPALKEFQPFADPGLADVDTRTAVLRPTAAQLKAVRALGARATWNGWGTPESLIKQRGYLATGLDASDAQRAARTWLKQHASLFRLTPARVDALELVNDSRMAGSQGHAVLFRQRFGDLPAAVDGMVTVGVVSGKIAFVSSSLTGNTAAPSRATTTAQQAWLAAAANVGRSTTADKITGVVQDASWTRFSVQGFAQQQQARLVALPLRDGSVRAVWEVNVVDSQKGGALAYTSFVDASTRAVLVRHGRADAATENESFSGAITAATCGPLHPFQVDADTKSIVASASTAIVTNDIVLQILDDKGQLLASGDTGTSPEVVTYTVPAGAALPAVYNVQVCPYDTPTVPYTDPGDYAGVVTTSDSATPGGSGAVPYPPKWKYFTSNPTPVFDAATTDDNRKVGCWVTSPAGAGPACDASTSPLKNLAARGPWDFDFRTNTPTSTTTGNAATTAEAWGSPLTPGGAQRPLSLDRVYGSDADGQHPLQDFTDAWNNNRCSPSVFLPGVANDNDVLAATTSLFASHNRLHDWSYFLGFTEDNYNLQDSNFGNRADGMLPTAGELDPEVGNVQAGAATGGAPSYLGRDNANQITLQDGTPGITNQYLFQPIAGAFYAPCVDGDFDMSIVGHEYNHAISNRMVGGPDEGLNSFQGGSMGESWGDQIALEYQFENDYGLTGGSLADEKKDGKNQNHWVEGVYATGNTVTGIRNYALNDNPLQFGDLGYDLTGPEVHADGEPWSAVMWDVRQALVKKYNASFPEGDVALQRRCAVGNRDNAAPSAPLDAQYCPGNRRWIQLLFDAYSLQPASSGMLTARDAMLAADLMRFDGANQAVLWNAFAKRGYGEDASSPSTESDQPTPGYSSPYLTEGTLSFSAHDYTVPTGSRPAVTGTLYLGDYSARVTPVLDTDPTTPLPSTLKLVPGTYSFVFQADGFGLRRFTATVKAGQTLARDLHLSQNLASTSNGATATGSAGSLNVSKLIDDDEGTNWAATGQGVQGNGTGVSFTHPYVTVDLAGGAQMVRSVNVSALLRPADSAQDEDPNMPDESSGSRFTALRTFAVETCTQSPTSDCSSPLLAGLPGSPYSRIFTSADDAFPATLPRPLAPNLNLRSFDVPDTSATHVRLVALENQCTGTPGYQGEQDDDPFNATDCDLDSDRGTEVRAAEFQVFSFDASSRPPGDPVVASTMAAPATVHPGDALSYTIGYTNLGPEPSAGATITDTLPAGVTFVSASNGGTYDAKTRTVTWKLGTVAKLVTGQVTLTTRVPRTTLPGTTLLNQSQFAGALTFSPPAAAVTAVVS